MQCPHSLLLHKKKSSNTSKQIAYYKQAIKNIHPSVEMVKHGTWLLADSSPGKHLKYMLIFFLINKSKHLYIHMTKFHRYFFLGGRTGGVDLPNAYR